MLSSNVLFSVILHSGDVAGQECRCKQKRAGRFKQFRAVIIDLQAETAGQGLNSCDLRTVAVQHLEKAEETLEADRQQTNKWAKKG